MSNPDDTPVPPAPPVPPEQHTTPPLPGGPDPAVQPADTQQPVAPARQPVEQPQPVGQPQQPAAQPQPATAAPGQPYAGEPYAGQPHAASAQPGQGPQYPVGQQYPPQGQQYPAPTQTYPGQPQPGAGHPGQPQPGTGYPGQPYGTPGTGYPGQPYGTPGASYPGQPYGTPGASGPQPPRKGLGKGAIIGIIAGGVGLLVVLVIVIALTLAPGAGGSPAAGGAAGGSPSDAVTVYLEALADSDAESALAQLADRPRDESLLTDEMLTASNELAPMADISVEDVDSDSYATVPATYALGDVSVSTEFSVSLDEDGAWKIGTGVNELSLGTYFSGMDLTLNGIPVDGEQVTVFPGTYEFATTTEYFEITGSPIVTVEDEYRTPDFTETTATLDADGLAVFQQTINDAVAACLASKNLSAGCGLDLPATLDDGTVLTEGTITRVPRAETQAELANLQPTDAYSDSPLQVRSQSIGSIETTAECQKDGASGTCTLFFGPALGPALVDFGQDPVAVLWD
ncbi:hypothetical protein [Microbacterium hibisci]|uniref:hypothetical protein n=1 Tax=Microbacterium hibisci TaxID=2036000 RepID=UPI001943354A|nr:hypothetical protein [Microbacterium hibisci]